MPVFAMIWSLALILIGCILGELVTKGFTDIYDAIFQLNWFSFPKDMRRMWPTVLIAAQEMIVIQGFANLGSHTREDFKRVRLITSVLILPFLI